jgi:hypothetical protein
MGFEQLSHDELVALYKAKNDGGRVPSRKAALIAALKRAGVEEPDVEQLEEEEELEEVALPEVEASFAELKVRLLVFFPLFLVFLFFSKKNLARYWRRNMERKVARRLICCKTLSRQALMWRPNFVAKSSRRRKKRTPPSPRSELAKKKKKRKNKNKNKKRKKKQLWWSFPLRS